VTNLPLLDQAAAGVGGLNLSTRDRAGIVRRIPMLFSDGSHVYPGLAAEALRVAQRQSGILVRSTGSSGEANTGNAALLDMRVGDFTIPLTDKGEAWLYYGPSRPERHLSAKDVLDPSKDDELRPRLEGQIVFVGVSAAASRDIHATPLGQLMTGAEIQAQLTEQVLAQSFIVRPDWADGLEVVLTVALGILLSVLLIGIGARFSFIAGLAAVAAAIAGSWFAFSHLRLLLDPIYPSLAAAIVYVVIERVLRVASDTERKFVRQAFQQYLAPELLHRLEHLPEAMELGGETRDVSVMFMDVRGFTTLSEQLTAHELVEFINTLLSPLSDAIQAELGTIDKYIGDSIMAFWNAPLDIAGHPERACRAALAMRGALKALNEANAFAAASAALDQVEIKIGIGINYGKACVGNMGSARRFNYSAVGDVVNVAARIEAATKALGTDILISREIVQQATSFAWLEAGAITLKGKSQATTLYALVGDDTFAATPGFAELRRHHDRMIDAISNDATMDARAALSSCRRLAPHQLAGFYDHFAALIENSRAHSMSKILTPGQ
jgi:adenylate cyclase